MTDHFQKCTKCGEVMGGIRCHKAREVCEDCGGNETKFDKENMNPESAFNKNRQPQKSFDL